MSDGNMHAYRDTIEWGMKDRIRFRTILLYSLFRRCKSPGGRRVAGDHRVGERNVESFKSESAVVPSYARADPTMMHQLASDVSRPLAVTNALANEESRTYGINLKPKTSSFGQNWRT